MGAGRSSSGEFGIILVSSIDSEKGKELID